MTTDQKPEEGRYLLDLFRDLSAERADIVALVFELINTYGEERIIAVGRNTAVYGLRPITELTSFGAQTVRARLTDVTETSS